ncbi:hypothetical protein SARC_09319 [Sphaeroforma arctica JP610]|uniref:Major facilitator superfamily (MFS) profile domain-containing protein n=1 Tax=Sphaeroforma arctica JP610 TaxID=667725 RepID=A0A0L0FNE3_9EUKA|nr:hypothetical protein SARC_09319 [Sphaeroforma arctica JP610]KNC78244.1 hypothetical protein SARC_09319 [Sphaeroforma arctica JP610]|eukprot:XP_014152146.1 hypothetical protein SARC_09319 [Sphaeroforma arctica JP610]
MSQNRYQVGQESKVDIEVANEYFDVSTVSAGFARKLDVPLPTSLLTGCSQNIIAGFVCFCCPGMFNAMQGLGNAGGSDPAVSAAMNAALNGTFAIAGYFGGLLFNLFGNKLLMVLGGLTYCFYSISVYLWRQDDKYVGMAIAASSILGVGAGMLWTAQETMSMSYATEDKKGMFTDLFWIIFNLGGVVGGGITFFINTGGEDITSMNEATYFMFCGIMVFGAVVALLLTVHPSRVIKADGHIVTFDKAASPAAELKSVFRLFQNKYMLLLTPLIIQSNWFYTYEFGAINGNLFDPETRGLNSAVYWVMQMVGAYAIGTVFLDNRFMGRRQRAIYGLIIISTFNIAQWAYAAWFQFT